MRMIKVQIATKRFCLGKRIPRGCNLHSTLVNPAVENYTANFTVFQNSLSVAQLRIRSCPGLSWDEHPCLPKILILVLNATEGSRGTKQNLAVAAI